MPGDLPVVARCTKCGRDFVLLGNSDRDAYPPLGWRPKGWPRWRGNGVDETAPVCGGWIMPISRPDTAPSREGGE